MSSELSHTNAKLLSYDFSVWQYLYFLLLIFFYIIWISFQINFLIFPNRSRSFDWTERNAEWNQRIAIIYGDFSSSMPTVVNRFSVYQRGSRSVYDEPRPGAPKTTTMEDNLTKVRDLVFSDL